MKFRPIPFTTPMVQAILSGHKVMTRRIVKDAELLSLINGEQGPGYFPGLESTPYGLKGDCLWVRESYSYRSWQLGDTTPAKKIIYKADGESSARCHNWIGGRFLPKKDARIFLEITQVYVQRVQSISEKDAELEGAERGIFREGPNTEKGEFHLELNHHAKYYNGFKYLWCSLNGRESWENNDWVYVITFKKIDKPANFI